MRTHLVTKLVCTKCGLLLNLSYEKVRDKYSEQEPTGAAMYQNIIGVEPCRGCLEPARKILEAVKTLNLGATP